MRKTIQLSLLILILQMPVGHVLALTVSPTVSTDGTYEVRWGPTELNGKYLAISINYEPYIRIYVDRSLGRKEFTNQQCGTYRFAVESCFYDPEMRKNICGYGKSVSVRVEVPIPEEPEQITLVSYNSFNDGDAGGLNWGGRLAQFAFQFGRNERPAIIGMQEVVGIAYDCAVYCGNCNNIPRGRYLQRLLEYMEKESGIKYKIATFTADPNGATMCTGTEHNGEAILYDPGQVRLISLPPKVGNCKEWRGSLESYYGHNRHTADCFFDNKKETGSPHTTMAVFEYPINSNQYFKVYNTHGTPCNIMDAIEYIVAQQDTLRQDLMTYLNKSSVKLYPPVYLGDMNSHEYIDCPDMSCIFYTINSHFIDAPHGADDPPDSLLDDYVVSGDPNDPQNQLKCPSMADRDCLYEKYIASGKYAYNFNRSLGKIDKVWIGKPDTNLWDYDVHFKVVRPSKNKFLFKTLFHGYSADSSKNKFSDHSPAMSTVEPINSPDPDIFPGMTKFSYSRYHLECPECQGGTVTLLCNEKHGSIHYRCEGGRWVSPEGCINCNENDSDLFRCTTSQGKAGFTEGRCINGEWQLGHCSENPL